LRLAEFVGVELNRSRLLASSIVRIATWPPRRLAWTRRPRRGPGKQLNRASAWQPFGSPSPAFGYQHRTPTGEHCSWSAQTAVAADQVGGQLGSFNGEPAPEPLEDASQAAA